MAVYNTPPPYSNIAGIAKSLNNHVQNCSISAYNGNAKPGELVVDMLTFNLYVGNDDGNLLPISGGGGNGTPGGSNTQIQFNDSSNFGATANLTFDKSLNQFSVLSGSQVLGNVGSTPSSVANSVIIYNKAPGAGATGLYVVSSTTNDEVTAYNKAKLLAIIL